MDAAGHLAAAEQLLTAKDNGVNIAPTLPGAIDVAEATAHALCAIAIELGAPHGPAEPGSQVTP